METTSHDPPLTTAARRSAWRQQGGVRWLIVGLAFLGTAINYVDRANLGVAEHAIRHELGLSKAQMGLILSAFFSTYAFAQLPAGWIVDRLGARVTYTAACLWWSLF